MHKDGNQSYNLQLGWSFQDLIDSYTHFCSIQSFGVPNETLVNLVIDIFKLSTSREISLSGWTFGQKDFTQVAQVQISPDGGARHINFRLLTKNEQSTYKSVSRDVG